VHSSSAGTVATALTALHPSRSRTSFKLRGTLIDARRLLASLMSVRAPAHRERRFQRIVNADSGIVNTDSSAS